MSKTKQDSLFLIRKTWMWDSRNKVLYLFDREFNSSFFCNIIHKLSYFSPERVLVNLDGKWYEIYGKPLDSLKECSRKVKEEKNKLYRILVEESVNKEDSYNNVQRKICITPFYGSLYLDHILDLNLSSEILARCDLDEKYFPNDRVLNGHNYSIGHLVYSIDSMNNLYRVYFSSDVYYWLNKELSTALSHAYSKKMFVSGKFKHIYEYRFNIGLKLLNLLTLEEIEGHIGKHLVKHAVYSSIGLSKIFPLIIDENVQNFFLDDINKKIYLDHAIFGRLNTNLKFNEKDFESFVSLVKRESNLNLDYANPSIKTTIVFDNVSTRVSIDIPPLTWSKGVIDVRKHRADVLSFSYLLETDYFSPESAALLILATLNRANVSIVGEPNSGKTSLLNFLSYFMPSWWRIVHIEDALETLPPRISNQHRIVYIVEPFESKDAKSTKTLEIIKVLHRTPSYLILGEIQTKNHVKAMFQAISAGLRVMHTAHASDSDGFIKRIVEVYRVPKPLVSELDLIVVMKKIETGNSIRRFISEIAVVNNDSNLKIIYSNYSFLNPVFFDDSNISKLLEKLSRVNCIDERILEKMYEEILRIINNNKYLENRVLKKLIIDAYLKALKKGEGFEIEL
ncbi:MAG: ATPase, T2SS/T4P/T4SS family [Thermoproteota archaeon]